MINMINTGRIKDDKVTYVEYYESFLALRYVSGEGEPED